MEKKTGTAGTLVQPAGPTDALEADNADPGTVEEIKAAQKQAKTGKYGSVPAQPFTPPEALEAKELSWIGVELKDNDGNPLPGIRFSIKNAEGRTGGGTTGSDGKGRIDGIYKGNYEITFPDLDAEVWEPA